MPPASPGTDPLTRLCAAIEAEARRGPFDVCVETYEAAGRDPAVPIVCTGRLDASTCLVGRELGREEVHAGEPLVGMGGRRLRRALHEALVGPAPKSERRFDSVLEHVFFTNLVPYRPVGNKAYSQATKARFRPFVERLLAGHWTGDRVLALGKTSFEWFAPYVGRDTIRTAWSDPDTRFLIDLPMDLGGRQMTLGCLPHPSPLSPFKQAFPGLVRQRFGG